MEYFSCPNLFIASTVNEYLAMRKHLKDYPHTAVAFHDQDPRYVAMDRYFNARLAEYTEMVQTKGEVL